MALLGGPDLISAPQHLVSVLAHRVVVEAVLEVPQQRHEQHHEERPPPRSWRVNDLPRPAGAVRHVVPHLFLRDQSRRLRAHAPAAARPQPIRSRQSDHAPADRVAGASYYPARSHRLDEASLHRREQRRHACERRLKTAEARISLAPSRCWRSPTCPPRTKWFLVSGSSVLSGRAQYPVSVPA